MRQHRTGNCRRASSSIGDDVLPTKGDFDPWGSGDLDAEHAWRNFGGLTLAEAHLKFRENPGYYQENFMFMGGKAFAFYFPVIEDYLSETPEMEGEGDREAWIIAKCIQIQLEAKTAHHVAALAERIIALSKFIQANIFSFGEYEEERRRISAAWQELEAQLRLAGKPDGAS